jgi:hypothetical protein
VVAIAIIDITVRSRVVRSVAVLSSIVVLAIGMSIEVTIPSAILGRRIVAYRPLATEHQSVWISFTCPDIGHWSAVTVAIWPIDSSFKRANCV